MIDSVLPVKMLPEKNQSEYGIGIHASAENDSLLVIVPEVSGFSPARAASAALLC